MKTTLKSVRCIVTNLKQIIYRNISSNLKDSAKMSHILKKDFFVFFVFITFPFLFV